jgi:spore coat polysaccharide biosynthesis predicted glycosyltransferase SpsG
MFRLYLSHHLALKAQIHTVNEQCIVGSPTLTIHRVNNNENMYVTVPMVYNNGLSNRI